MGKLAMNSQIIKQFYVKLEALGLDAKLKLFPIENAFTRRPRYWSKEGVCYFSVLMWQLNDLDSVSLEQEINARIAAARTHFGI